MVYDRTNIVENYRGLIGFMPSYDISNLDAQIDDSLRQSLSGVYLNDLHEFFTPEIFSNVASQFNTYTVSSWSNIYTYPKGSIVSRTGVIYKATAITTGEQPEAGVNWARTTLLSSWVQQKYDSAVLAMFDALRERSTAEGYGKEIKGTNMPLYNSEGLKSNIIAKSGRFVGYKITPKVADISISLQRIGMQLSEAMQVPIHIRYNGQEHSIDFNFTRENKFHYLDVMPDPNITTTFRLGDGEAVIGYYEDDLQTASAIGLVSNIFAQGGCRSCGVDAAFRNGWDKYITVEPISILNDEEEINYSTNFGLNLVFSFKCDLSDVFIREKMSAISLLRAQLKLTFLSAIAGTARNNQKADQTSIQAFNQLENYEDPENPKIALQRSLKAMSFDFSGLNSICLPCNNKTRIRSGVI